MNNTGRKNTGMDDNTPPNATEEMLADLGVSGAAADQLRTLLDDVAGLAHELPEPSDDVRALLGGAVPLRRRHRRAAFVAAAAGALALGGVSAAAATNRLPDRVQEVVADAANGVLPVDIPHPVKPTNPPYDAPGHVFNKPKASTSPRPEPSKTPRPLNTTAPGQIQKLTKPDPTAPGPAHPADPGSHGRAHHPDKTDSPEQSDDDSHQGTDSGKSDTAGRSHQD